MADMTRKEAFDKMEILKKSFCGNCYRPTLSCTTCDILLAFEQLKNDLKKLEAYENADLIERDKAKDVELPKRNDYKKKDYLNAVWDYCVAIDNIPRFEPTICNYSDGKQCHEDIVLKDCDGTKQDCFFRETEGSE